MSGIRGESNIIRRVNSVLGSSPDTQHLFLSIRNWPSRKFGRYLLLDKDTGLVVDHLNDVAELEPLLPPMRAA